MNTKIVVLKQKWDNESICNIKNSNTETERLGGASTVYSIVSSLRGKKKKQNQNGLLKRYKNKILIKLLIYSRGLSEIYVKKILVR